MKLLMVMFACMLPVLGATPAQQTPNQTPVPATSPAPSQAVPAPPVADGRNLVNPVKPTAESQAKAKKMYGWDCAMCHGENGNGKGDLAVTEKLTMLDYTNPASLKGMSDGELFVIIRDGKGQQMPSEGSRAGADDIWNLVIYLRSFSKK